MIKNIIDKIQGKFYIKTNIRLRRRVNTLQNKVDELEEIIKNKLYKDFLETLNENIALKGYKDTNIRLRSQVRDLKNKIKELEEKNSKENN